MLEEGKPLLRRFTVAYPFGVAIPSVPYWSCVSRFTYGTGRTPESAYDDWKKNRMPILGRAFHALMGD
jgi:hypothetical protein